MILCIPCTLASQYICNICNFAVFTEPLKSTLCTNNLKILNKRVKFVNNNSGVPYIY